MREIRIILQRLQWIIGRMRMDRVFKTFTVTQRLSRCQLFVYYLPGNRAERKKLHARELQNAGTV